MTCNIFSSPPTIVLHQIPEGYAGTMRTVAHILALIRQGAKDFCVRQSAIDVLRQRAVRPKDYLGEIKALFEWVQQNIRYTRDTFRLELLHSARRMLQLRAGDCDDISIVLGAMLESIGHPVRLVITGPDPQRRDLFSHIYLEALCKGRWITLDATMPHPMGWAPATPVKKVIPIDRRPSMIADDMGQGVAAPPAIPDWLRGFIRAVRREAIAPKDQRVKMLWDLMRQRQVLSSNPWVRGLLQRCWKGLPARDRPRTTARLVAHLRELAILPPRPLRNAAPGTAQITDPRNSPVPGLTPVRLQPVGTLKPAQFRPVQPVQLRPIARGVAR